jgi:hypothetical protein
MIGAVVMILYFLIFNMKIIKTMRLPQKLRRHNLKYPFSALLKKVL